MDSSRLGFYFCARRVLMECGELLSSAFAGLQNASARSLLSEASLLADAMGGMNNSERLWRQQSKSFDVSRMRGGFVEEKPVSLELKRKILYKRRLRR